MQISINRHDAIALIAPASGGLRAKQYLDDIQSLLKNYDFKVKISEKILHGDCLNFFAASKKSRLGDLNEVISNPAIKIIIGIRGGYGSSEIVFDLLNTQMGSDKIFIGYSDLTMIHALFNQHYNMPSIHGSLNQDSLETIINILKGESKTYDLTPLNSVHNKSINSTIIGGNLTIICTTIGTKLKLKTAGKILLLEDVNEPGYKIHRNLLHLKNAGLLAKVKAIIFADFTKSDENLNAALDHFIQIHIPDIPTFRVKNIGHGEKNEPIVLNSKTTIINNKLVVKSPFRCI